MDSQILVVEDNEAKLDSIVSLIKKDFSGLTVQTALSVKSAIDFLRQQQPDLIIADMSLPTYDIEKGERGGTPRPFGGIEVFEHLDRYDLDVPVVVVTSYPSIADGENTLNLAQLRDLLQKDFPRIYHGAVYFDSAYSTWENELCDLINNITGQ